MFIFFIYYIFLSLFILIFFAIYKSTKIIYNPIKKEKNAIYFLKPVLIGPEFNEFPTLELLCNLYKNYIFEIVYIRIAIPGKYIKYWSFLAIKTIFIISLMACFIFLIQLIKFIFNFKKKINFTEFIYLNYDNIYDTRKLSFINNEWIFNPKKEFYNIITLKNTDLSEHLINKTFDKFFLSIKNLNCNPQLIHFELCDHKTNDNIEVSHYITSNTKMFFTEKFLYLTDHHKALKHNWYNNHALIPNFKGPLKDTSLLDMNLYSPTYLNRHLNLSSTRFSQGLCHSDISGLNDTLTQAGKFNIDLIGNKILSDYNNYKNVWFEFKYNSDLLKIDYNQAFEAYKYLCYLYM